MGYGRLIKGTLEEGIEKPGHPSTGPRLAMTLTLLGSLEDLDRKNLDEGKMECHNKNAYISSESGYKDEGIYIFKRMWL